MIITINYLDIQREHKYEGDSNPLENNNFLISGSGPEPFLSRSLDEIETTNMLGTTYLRHPKNNNMKLWLWALRLGDGNGSIRTTHNGHTKNINSQ